MHCIVKRQCAQLIIEQLERLEQKQQHVPVKRTNAYPSRPDPALLLCHAETKLVIDPGLDSWSRLEPDRIVVQTLDAANARVISNVLGQSVALDSYNV